LPMEQIAIILAYVMGMAFMVAEVFMPGAIMGILGLIVVLGSIYFAFQRGATGLGVTLVCVTVAAVPVLIVLWVKVINRVLAIQETQTGYTSAQVGLKELVGQEGVAVTQLRPSGIARFGDKKVDVVSEDEVIVKDTRVTVVEVQSNRVVVRAVRG